MVIALSATKLVDTVQIVAEKKKRRRTIPIWGEEYEWWTDAVERQLDPKGMDQKDLAKALGVHPSVISRCVNRKSAVYEVVIAISDYLVISYPVILPTSEAEAAALSKAKRLFKRDVQAAQIKPGVPEISQEDQTPAVQPEHAVRSKKAKRRAGRAQTSV